MRAFEQWKASRIEEAQLEQGELALVGMYEIGESTTIEGIPGIWSKLADNKPGLLVTASKEDQLYIDGKQVEGQATIVADETVIRVNEQITVTATYQPGSLHLLAVWNNESDNLQKFEMIDTYAYDSSFVLKGKLVINSNERTFIFEHSRDQDQQGSKHQGRTHESIGEIHFEYNGYEARMRPFAAGDYLIVVFRDTTSGNETYGMGRMLLIEYVEGKDEVELDFNRSFLPPCAFSPYFNCPMPPVSNRLPIAIHAGEKNVIWKQA